MPENLNPLPPSRREKNRYLVYSALSEKPLRADELGRAIWKTALELLGELGVSRLGLRIIDFNEEKQKGIIKVKRGGVDEARLVLALVGGINGRKIALKTIGVSGILKKARGKWI